MPTGFIAGAKQHPTAASFNLTLPAGAVLNGWCVAIAANSSGTLCSEAIAGSTVLVSAAANNMSFRALAKQLNSTDISNGFLAVTSSSNGHDMWILAFDTTVTGFDTVNSFPLSASFYGTRGGVSQTFVTAPSVTPNSGGDYCLLISSERTTATGTTVVSIGQGVQDYYSEDTVTTNVSVLAASFTGPASGVATGTDTVTYSGASGNAIAFLLPMTAFVLATVTLSGVGALTAGGVDTVPVAVAMDGVGTLTANPSGSAVTAAVTLAGSGTLTVSGVDTISPAVAMIGTGTLAVVPAATQVAAFLTLRPSYAAHRGGSDNWPEETLYAYSHAALWNPSIALEASVWQCTTGEYVLSHDQTTGRVFGTNLDIPTTPWSTLQSLRTTVGNRPIARLTDMLAIWGGNRVIMVDNKGLQNNSTLLNLLDSFGGNAWFIAKGFITATGWADAAGARSYQSWGYGYSADIAVNFPANQSHWTTLGLDYQASGSDWTTVLGYGKVTLAHIVATQSNATTALGLGAMGLMVSGVVAVIPEIGVESPDLTMVGGGTLSITSLVTHSETVALTGTGTLTAVPVGVAVGTAILVGGGGLVAVGVDTVAAMALLAGLATLVATVTVNPPAGPAPKIAHLALEPDRLRALAVEPDRIIT